MLRSSLGSQSQLSGYKYREEISLLQLKDQQIRRLQVELEQQKKRADAAVKMLQNFKAIQKKHQEGGETLRSQISRRIKVQQDMKKLQQRNVFLFQIRLFYNAGLKNILKRLNKRKQSKKYREIERYDKTGNDLLNILPNSQNIC